MKEGTALARLICKIRACKDKVTRKGKEKKKANTNVVFETKPFKKIIWIERDFWLENFLGSNPAPL